MIAYKFIFLDGSERPWEVFNQIEIVKAKDMADFVDTMYADGRICDESYEIFKEKHPLGCMTESDAVELLKLDGYDVEKIEI